MKLYGRSTSFNVQKVLWFLHELNVDFEHIQVGGRFGGLDSAEFKALNPNKKIPVLIDEGKAIWESHTIIRYLAATADDENWYSVSPYSRSLQERWMDWSQSVFQPAFIRVFWGFYRMPPSQRDMVAVNAELAKCIGFLNILDHQLSQTAYLAGEKFSLADVPTGAVIYRLTEQGIAVELPPNVRRWYEGLKQRQGYQTGIMSDFSELKGREGF